MLKIVACAKLLVAPRRVSLFLCLIVCENEACPLYSCEDRTRKIPADPTYFTSDLEIVRQHVVCYLRIRISYAVSQPDGLITFQFACDIVVGRCCAGACCCSRTRNCSNVPGYLVWEVGGRAAVPLATAVECPLFDRFCFLPRGKC